jgi:hypothetical protein
VVITVDEQLKIFRQGLHSSGEASRFASQTFQVMTEIGIDCFHGIGLLFIGPHFIGSPIIKIVISRKGIAVVLFGLRRSFQASLQGFAGSFNHDIPTQDTASVSIHNG